MAMLKITNVFTNETSLCPTNKMNISEVAALLDVVLRNDTTGKVILKGLVGEQVNENHYELVY